MNRTDRKIWNGNTDRDGEVPASKLVHLTPDLRQPANIGLIWTIRVPERTILTVLDNLDPKHSPFPAKYISQRVQTYSWLFFSRLRKFTWDLPQIYLIFTMKPMIYLQNVDFPQIDDFDRFSPKSTFFLQNHPWALSLPGTYSRNCPLAFRFYFVSKRWLCTSTSTTHITLKMWVWVRPPPLHHHPRSNRLKTRDFCIGISNSDIRFDDALRPELSCDDVVHGA